VIAPVSKSLFAQASEDLEAAAGLGLICGGWVLAMIGGIGSCIDCFVIHKVTISKIVHLLTVRWCSGILAAPVPKGASTSKAGRAEGGGGGTRAGTNS